MFPRLRTQEEFLKIVKKIHSDKYDYSLIEYNGAKSKIKIICPVHDTFIIRSDIFLNGNGCPKCSKEQKMKDNEICFLEKSKKVHNDKYDYSLVRYKNKSTKIKIICPTHGIFEQYPIGHLYGGCKKCSDDKNRKTVNEFIKQCIKIHGNKYDYSLVDYKRNDKKIKIICPIHGIFEQRASNHLNGQNCIKCENKNKRTNEEFIIESKKTHGDKYDYSLVDYTNNISKVKIICPVHGVFKQQPIKHIRGNGCPSCKESKGEKVIRKILDENNIFYEYQKSFKNCKHMKVLKFDFYIPHLNCCIEYDGEQHFSIVEKWGGFVGLESRIKKDRIKDDFCKDNNIQLHRIRFDENVNEKMKELLAF